MAIRKASFKQHVFYPGCDIPQSPLRKTARGIAVKCGINRLKAHFTKVGLIDVKDRILHEIKWIINQEIQQEHLQATIQKYVEAQTENGFPFAELVVLHYQMLNGSEPDKVISVAAAIELLVLSFDILDDIEDGDDHLKLWMQEQSVALNASAAMIFLCLDVVKKADLRNKEKAVSILLKHSLLAISGQHMDLMGQCRTEQDYIEMALKKSGSLVSLACLAGAVLARDDYPQEIRQYAQFMGLIGQLNNDISDLQTWEGKNDLINRKISLPIIYLLNFESKEADIIRAYYQGSVEIDELLGKRERMSRLIVESGALLYTEVMKRMYQQRARDRLNKLDADRQYIHRLLDYIL
ncbi:polyprenyl synthetase family protein [Siminovitchia sp. 179-K 8D1 HS]|uniref:polyprenyl synthetase family protein n=1 Tax=Siminovitchia sp. 179-K 8D1 HS TaxID=3142385 RepID=UPI0039A3C039